MNRHDESRDHDHGWADPGGTDLLAQTLGAMAGGVDPASPTGPAAALTTMSRRVRLRRGAKLGGLGGGALAVAGALVLGAAQLVPLDQPETLLPGATAPSPVEPSPSSSGPDLQIQDGYQPSWLEWSDLTCGMQVADLESTAPGWSVEVAGDIYDRPADLGGGESVTVRGLAATVQQGDGVLQGAPVLVWSQGGVVVDLGDDAFEGSDLRAPLVGSGADVIEAKGGASTTCAPSGTGESTSFKTPLPEGDYEVRVVAFPQAASGGWTTAVSEPVPVRIDSDGAHSPTRARGGESAIEFPEPVGGQVARFELDRTTDWVTAELTQPGYSSDTPMRVMGQCEGPDPEATLPIEVVLWPMGEVLASTQISCDGAEAGSEVDLQTGEGAIIDIRLPSIPDGVGRAWVSLEPATPQGGDTAGE
ncbi:hypothetical protein [Promicromonospora sukumoe]|uniref:hypothetical protein n=1 Tax=Promicromonospora sukumoe TaxID=88382 RepID=UPI00036A805A|nr:hypothetical protein [Promicromonospora sukumoe]